MGINSFRVLLYFYIRCKKISSNKGEIEIIDYGDICKINDKIGLLLEFTDKGLDVSFFLNKIDLGIAFKDLPVNYYYPCVILLYEGAKVRIKNRVPLPDY